MEGEFSPVERRRAAAEAEARLFGGPASPVTVGRFELLEQLGAGGAGVVYAARDPNLDRRVALKLLRPDANGPAGRTRLVREAQAMARVADPHVVAVHEVGEDGGQVFIAMEFVDGTTLRRWLAQGRGPDQVIDAFVRAGRGLAAAHAAGLTHRDFKPENVLVRGDGRVQVTDFGLVRSSRIEATTDDGDADPRLTRHGATLGTPAYMAPEQHAGADADAAADQFALCVALYEALYGRLPYDTEALADQKRHGPPTPPRTPGVPAHIWPALRRGLAPDPQARWPDLRALLTALTIDPQRKLKRTAWIVGITLVGGMAVFGAVLQGIMYFDYLSKAREAENP